MKPIYTKNRVIGLLGGSFNPAHEGHLQLSLCALKTLKLDAVWWLVSPQNPLKAKPGTAYADRLRSAQRAAAGHPRLHVSDIEARLGTHYTVDTVTRLMHRHPGARFVWLMGADNLAQLHRWRRWKKLCQLIPVAVFDRAPYSHAAMHSQAFLAQRRFLLKNNKINDAWEAPSLLFIPMRRHPASSTRLRKSLEKKAS